MSVSIALRFRMRDAFLLALALAVLFAQSGGQAQGTPPLPYSTGYLVTGNYVVGSVDFTDAMTGTIPISGVPQHADILAAFMYMEVIHPTFIPIQQVADFITFRGEPIKSVRVKSVGQALTGSTAACFTAAGPLPLTMTMLRADVLRLLPRLLDTDLKPTGKLVVNSADLTSNGYSPHTVTAPDRIGNTVVQTAGASLVLVYRVLDPSEPLRKIVVRDGIYIQTGQTTTQTIQGIYQSDLSNKQAKITFIGGKGANNNSDRLELTTASGTSLIAPDPASGLGNPFPSSSRSSDRSWAAPTYEVGPRMPGTDITPYGETVTATLSYTRRNPFPCQSLTANWFSANVLDAEDDGIPDRLEEALAPLQDPDGATLPDIHAIEGNLAPGLSSSRRHLLIEFNALRTTGNTTYGDALSAPYESGVGPDGMPGTGDDKPFVGSVVAPEHNHMPTSEELTWMGKAYEDAGIFALFDVGANYHDLGADYLPSVGVGDKYLVPASEARGGEFDSETGCDAAEPTCHFPAFPGTIAWGFSLVKHVLGTDRDPTDPTFGVPRFDDNRNGLFHYIMYAHFRGKPRSLPCLDPFGSPTLYESDGQCAVEANPSFYELDHQVPTSSSGAADLPGWKALVTLGRWENFVGTPITRAGTSVHELGHNLWLWHGGAAAQLLNEGTGLVKLVPENCKPNYLSVMSYMHQVLGLRDASNIARVALSSAENATLDETLLQDMSILAGEVLGSLPYKPVWYVPLGSVPPTLADILGLPAATRLCPGGVLPAGVTLARFEAPTDLSSIDWATDGFSLGEAASGQDINLDDIGNTTLAGFNDWANIRLDQVGGGHFMGGGISNGGEDFGGEDFGGEDFGGEDFGGEDFGGEDFGGEDFGGEDFGGVDFDASEFGASDFGGEDFGGQGNGDTELTHEDAIAQSGGTGSPPEQLEACVLGGNLPGPGYPRNVNGNLVGSPACEAEASTPLHRTRLTWNPPTLLPDPTMPVELYHVFRVTGATVTEDSEPVEVGTTTGTSFVDSEQPDGVQFTYYVKADFSDGTTSGASNFSTVTARNDAPVAIADAFSVNEDTLLNGNVLAPNQPTLTSDVDEDSPTLDPVLVTGPVNGTLLWEPGVDPVNGSFTYTPNPNYYGPDGFTYRLMAGPWSDPPPDNVSEDSELRTVSITVNPINDAPSFTKGPDQTVLEDAPQTVPNWATNISAGPVNETNGACVPLIPTVCSQTVAFLVTNDNAALFSAPPAVDGFGTLTYTPAPNANGTAMVTVTAQDTGGTAFGGIDTSAPQTFVITVTAVNDQPTVTDQSVSTSEDTDLLLTLTGSDVETDASDLTVAVTMAPEHGTVSLSTFTYTPDEDYFGPDSFKFTVTDRGDPDNCATLPTPPPQGCAGALTSAEATVNVTVTEVNDAPIAEDDSGTTTVNTPIDFSEADLFANDSPGPANESGQTLTVTNVGSAVNGNVVLNEDGTITFTPTSGLTGLGSFTYEVCDDGTTNGMLDEQCASAAVTVTVDPLIVGNSASFGSGPIATFNFATGATVGSFVPTGAVGQNGRGVAVLGNEVYYTEIAPDFGPTDFIRVAPFNGGAGGADTRTIANPRPGTGIQDLAFFEGVLYVLTGYIDDPLQVFGLNPFTEEEVLSGPVAIAGPASPNSDGFTVLPNGNFLINNLDMSCTYNEYNPTTGALILDTTIGVPDGVECTGVDTDGVSLYFQRNFNSLVQTDLEGAFIASIPVSAPSPGCAPLGDRTQCIEDISVVK